MKTLDEIMVACESDKASVFTRTFAKPHDYCRHLEIFFEPLRDKGIKFAEIGCGGGESMRAWLQFFEKAHIWGIDIVHSTNPWNTPGTKVHDRYTFVAGDQSDPNFWAQFFPEHGDYWDVVVEDGGHAANQVITTFNSVWPHIKSGGLFVCEDLACSYSPIFLPAGWQSPMEMLKLRLDVMHAGIRDIDSIYFARELAILKKV